MTVTELVAWLRNVAPAYKEGTARGFAFNMDRICLQELNAKINEAADRLESLLSDRAKLEERLSDAVACLTWIASLGYEGAPDISMRRAARKTIERLAALNRSTDRAT